MWRKHKTSVAVLEVLHGLGRMLQEIDAKLERIVDLLEQELGDE